MFGLLRISWQFNAKIGYFESIRRCSFTANEKISSFEKDYMRKVIQRMGGCVLFQPNKRLEAIIAPKSIIKEENEVVSRLATFARTLTVAKLTSNSIKEILNKFDEQCMKGYATWPVDTRLHALDVWHNINGARHSSSFGNMLTRFLIDFDKLSHEQAMQVLYYVACFRRPLQSSEETKIIKRFLENMDRLTLDEVCIYSLALFKTDANVNSSKVVSSLIDCLLSCDLRKYDSIAVSGIIKAVRRYAVTDHIVGIKNLQKKLIPLAKYTDLIALTHIIQLGI